MRDTVRVCSGAHTSHRLRSRRSRRSIPRSGSGSPAHRSAGAEGEPQKWRVSGV